MLNYRLKKKQIIVILCLIIFNSIIPLIRITYFNNLNTTVTLETPINIAASNDDWLSVDGNRIVDAQGKVVKITGINWFGFETSTQGFDGLWAVRLDDALNMIADLGFNLLRLPLCVQLVTEWVNGNSPLVQSINDYISPELAGITSLDLLDIAIDYCNSIGLKVMLDMHRVVNSQMTNLWYYGSYNYQDWLESWRFLADRYAGNDAVVAMDVFNEPHGNPAQYPEEEVAKWDDSNDTNNWKKAVEDVSAIIHSENPNVLILVEGIEAYPKLGADYSSNNADDYFYNWWGGNLRAVADFPINIDRQDKLLYSPHDYGASVFQQDWFYPGFNKDTLYNDVWRDNWYYIVENGIAPLLIGEWGGPVSGDTQIWMEEISEFIDEMNLHQTFWCFNPNSGDTGGIVTHDWTTLEQEKYNIIERTLWKDNTGNYVSLDHEIGLGSSGTNIVEYYANGNPAPLPGGYEPIDTPPSINHPFDLSYIEGDTGNIISWTATDSDPSTYTISRDGSQVQSGSWTSGGA
ncbi:MAG: glycoside hydrolase family 5 protein, partial [Candidatus Lokiarchaeota archaeon]|nr:glycoside hydrolase family 5 protein [Candidatus Lokiarchaeota archaeon]